MALIENKNRARTLFIDQADYSTQHIYFDSKLENNDNWLDIWDLITNEPIPFSQFINIYAAQVEPQRALMESDYFLKLIEMCEITWEAEIEAIESGKKFE